MAQAENISQISAAFKLFFFLFSLLKKKKRTTMTIKNQSSWYMSTAKNSRQVSRNQCMTFKSLMPNISVCSNIFCHRFIVMLLCSVAFTRTIFECNICVVQSIYDHYIGFKEEFFQINNKRIAEELKPMQIFWNCRCPTIIRSNVIDNKPLQIHGMEIVLQLQSASVIIGFQFFFSLHGWKKKIKKEKRTLNY